MNKYILTVILSIGINIAFLVLVRNSCSVSLSYTLDCINNSLMIAFIQFILIPGFFGFFYFIFTKQIFPKQSFYIFGIYLVVAVVTSYSLNFFL